MSTEYLKNDEGHLEVTKDPAPEVLKREEIELAIVGVTARLDELKALLKKCDDLGV